MTRVEAIDIVCDIASRWGENAEEGLPSRIDPGMNDEQLRALTGTIGDEYDYELAVELRNLWKAVALLRT
jgi:hypothetical protein